MTPRKPTLAGPLFVACLYDLTIICYVVFRPHFFAFCFGLAAALATVSLFMGLNRLRNKTVDLSSQALHGQSLFELLLT
jgi:hypothetical protein